MAKAKSTFYHVRWHKVGINEAIAANIIGVSVEQIKQWDLEGAPIYVERLLLLWDRKYIGFDSWNGWYFSRGTLHFKKQQWRPENILEDRAFRESLMQDAAVLFDQWRIK